jgi:hypothetical protein
MTERLTSSPAHVSQLDGTPWAGFGCMGAVGAMALDAYTHGAIRPTMHQIRANQDDQAGGIGLDDVATAWRRGWGQRLTHGPHSFAIVLSELGKGRGVAITANYRALAPWRAPGSTFTGSHALWLDRPAIAVDGGRQVPGIVVYDPLRGGPTTIPVYVVKRAYTQGAGWGVGTYQAAPNPLTDPVGAATGAVGGAIDAATAGFVAGLENAIGHGALLAAIVGLAVLGVFLTFREPLVAVGRTAARARTGGLIG